MNNRPLDQYQRTYVDWRQAIKRNSRRSYIVIALFFLIYASIGLLVDVYIQAGIYPQADIPQLLYALITLQLFPIATLVMLGVSAFSLFITFMFYDKLMLSGTDYKEITPETARTIVEKQLYNVVEEMKVAAGLKYMPKVFIINADYMNAFASGYSEKSAMVAITRGLVEKLDRDELQAVMAHELSHIRHLDIKLTLMASLLSNLILIVIDLFFYNAIYANRGDSKSRNSLGAIIILLRYTLPIVSMLLILYLSRTRELMADAGCVELTRNNEPLARALIKIQGDYSANKEHYTQELQATRNENVRKEAYIFDPLQAGISAAQSISDLFSTHPNLETRLRALGFKKNNIS